MVFSFDPNKRALVQAEDYTRAFDPVRVREELEATVADPIARKQALEELDELARAGRTLTIKNMSRRLTELRTDLIGVDYLPLSFLDAVKLGAELVTRRLIDIANQEARR